MRRSISSQLMRLSSFLFFLRYALITRFAVSYSHALMLSERLSLCCFFSNIPPHYGKAKYEDMDEKSQQVIDEFQGKDEYSKVLENTTHYLYEVSSESLMALPG